MQVRNSGVIRVPLVDMSPSVFYYVACVGAGGSTLKSLIEATKTLPPPSSGPNVLPRGWRTIKI